MMKAMLLNTCCLALLVACTAKPIAKPATKPSEPKMETPKEAKMEQMQIPKNDGTDLAQIVDVKFRASDGDTVYASYAPSAVAKSDPLIILFHQAGSNGRGEYQNIMPRLRARGYHVLYVDQRSGGEHYGSENRTVKARGGKTKYCAAYADMEGALVYAKSLGSGPIFAWGSSYSAALVLKLASQHGDDLAGVLSFSPATGQAMGDCNANNFITGVNIPALGLRPDSEMARGGTQQRQMYTAQGLDYFVAKDGVHGSSMLDASRAKGDVEPTWKATFAFLEKHK